MPSYPKRVRCYREYTDDFIGSGEGRDVSFDYFADRSLGFRIGSFVLYRLIATPIAFLHSALFIRQRVLGRGKIRACRREVKRANSGRKNGRRANAGRKNGGIENGRIENGRTKNVTPSAGVSADGLREITPGVLLVCNHSERVGDAFTPSVVAFPVRTHVVVHPDNLALPVLGRLTSMLGAIPVPHDLPSARCFSRSVADKLARGHAVAVYPEAHLWEKYTGIRPFADSALDPAVSCGAPVFTCTRVYLRRPVVGYVTRLYIDGPFYPDPSLPRSAACRELSERLRTRMKERAGESNVEVIKYIKEESPEERISEEKIPEDK